MMEHNPDLIDRQIQDRQEAIRDGFAVSNGQRGMHPLRIAIGMAIIRAGEAVRGGRLERPVEVFPSPSISAGRSRRPRYARP
ncbi:MAG TPA: hypothetical protein VM450_11425 [Thermomicrobiales bacterium]|nr:hypothetical protein [Thermomicrobiales bacterium]